MHLSDFEILNSINSVLDNPDLKKQERLLNVIDKAWRKNEENLSENKVADEICMAYKNNEISLEALEKTNSRILLQCALGNDDFSKYNNIEQEEEDEECQGGDVVLALQHTTQGYSELTAMQSHCRLWLGVTMRATG